MKTPTPTPRTDAATYSADCLGKTLVTNRDCSRELERELGALTGTRTCTHHNDQQRAACPVCLVAALTAERDHWQEIAKAASAEREHNANVAQAMTAERDQLRAQLHALQLVCGTNDANKFETWIDRANARAERAEAELATERARLDSGTILLTVAGERVWHCGVDLRAAIDAGMREDAK